MPLTRIICPHCEQSVEVNMTSVTRSRECPNCGRNILLQFTTQEKRQRRKALLMPAQVAPEQEGEEPPGLAVTPMPIKGDIRDRMMADPEVRQRVRNVKASLFILGTIIAFVVLGSVFHWWSGMEEAVGHVVQEYNASRLTAADESEAQARADRKTVPSSPITFPKNVVPHLDENAVRADAEAQLKAVNAFLDAANVNERVNCVLNRKTAEPRMRLYYQKHPDGPIPHETVEKLGADSQDNAVLNFEVIQQDGARRRLIVRKSIKKGYLVDWPSFVIYSDMDWDDFLAARPQQPKLFRVMAGLGDVYRNSFIDPAKLICLRLVNPLDPHAPPLYAYAPRTTSVGHTLEFVMRRAAGSMVPVIVRLKYPDSGGDPNQVWVDDFVSEGWMTMSW
jgi:hypothetical protein